jgi:hypothetical protein
MTWVLWRQHRVQVAVLAGGLAVLGILLGVTGLQMAHEYEAMRNNCPDCSGIGLLNGQQLSKTIVNLTVAVPLLLGVFLGAGATAREIEQATHVLAWTQSMTRRRWLATKLAAVLLVAVVIAGAMSAMVTWWSSTLNSLQDFRFEGLQFDVQNLSPVAYSIFAVALGFAAGAVLRRTLPAVAVTVGGFLVLRLFVEMSLRPHYQAARHAASSYGVATPLPTGAWMLRADLVDPSGRTVAGHGVAGACASLLDPDECMNKLGYKFVTIFHPGDRYWPFQLTEAAIFVGLAAVCIAVGAVVMLRRDA